MLIGKKEWQTLGQEFFELKKKLAALEQESLNQKTAQNKTENLLTKLSDQLKQMQENHTNYGEEFSNQVSQVADNNEQMQKRITSFKILHDRASQKLLEDMNLELKSHLEVLYQTKSRYSEQELMVNNKLIQLNQKLEAVQLELTKFQQIAQEIKATDFQLTNFAKQVTREDAEKLRLMRENEKLKMLVAKIRTRPRR